MANQDTPFGFRPVRHLVGGTIRQSRYQIASGFTSDIFMGDLVLRGTTTRRLAIDVSGGIGAATILGAFAGCRYRAVNGEMVFSRYWPASTVTHGAEDAVAFVYDDPFIIYEAQADDAFALADIGTLADVVYAAGSTLTGLSKCTVGATGGADLLVYDVKRAEENEVAAANNKLYVLINTHTYRNAGVASYASV